jgi:hypothetical protein
MRKLSTRGVREKLITLTDSDILFVKGWQEEGRKVLNIL